MGLFSIFSKNKQESTAQDSGRFSREDAEYGQQARAKRASYVNSANSANESGQGGSRRSRSGGDPMLPEKKRARRRLVGAVALALAAAVGLPMLLDSEPRPLSGDIAIQIPSKEKAPALPMPAAPTSPVSAADSVDQDEEIIAPPPATPASRASTTPAAKPPVEKEAPPLVYAEREVRTVKPEPKVAEHKSEPKPAEHKSEPKPERKVAEKSAEKPAEKPAAKKTEDKPKPKDSEAARALALLEGKPLKPAEAHPRAEEKAEASQRFVVQVAALGTQEKVDELQARLRAGGISSFTKKSGALIKVQVGPFGSREEADRTKAKLGSMGLSGFLVPV
jgi:DedD protein